MLFPSKTTPPTLQATWTKFLEMARKFNLVELTQWSLYGHDLEHAQVLHCVVTNSQHFKCFYLIAQTVYSGGGFFYSILWFLQFREFFHLREKLVQFILKKWKFPNFPNFLSPSVENAIHKNQACGSVKTVWPVVCTYTT
jgi:hypothetical protein